MVFVITPVISIQYAHWLQIYFNFCSEHVLSTIFNIIYIYVGWIGKSHNFGETSLMVEIQGQCFRELKHILFIYVSIYWQKHTYIIIIVHVFCHNTCRNDDKEHKMQSRYGSQFRQNLAWQVQIGLN